MTKSGHAAILGATEVPRTMAVAIKPVEGEQSKRKVHRSPNYPGMSLKTALEQAQTIYNQEKRSFASPSVIQTHMGYTPKTGPAGRAISALKQYGLLEEKDGQYRVSERAYAILQLSEDSADRKTALKEAMLGPSIFREIIEHYDGNLPSDVNLRDYLIKAKSFNPASVGNFIELFRETVALAKGDGLADTEGSEERIETLPPMDSHSQPKLDSGGKPPETPYFRFSLNGATVEFRANAPLSQEHFVLIEAHLKALKSEAGIKNGK